ncbi:hypothetical protein BSK49_23420 [Paenibacillus odorifer]|uniref:DUF2627 domain-containing protein n=1 Tax=Paenibacillus odorifer TaxID=189426 RepID=A0ABX3GL53_9BACL|nr:DUF2627 domain-containing protein [Paenibacillus odorifer]OMD31128.1 hypothetical protein BSO21_17690 [Paenibacillus odorifer]OMD83785.1 hypothetical protein BSK49_23420 [Paenibacillus odorifer]
MKLLISRFIAILILVFPGLIAMKGFLMMKDDIFDYISMHGDDSVVPHFAWLHFGGGLLLFAAGMTFLGGWILARDRKKNYVGPRFKEKQKAKQAGTQEPIS